MNPTTVVTRLRIPRPTELVAVTLTGTPAAVTALARQLVAVATVIGMRHTPTTGSRKRRSAPNQARHHRAPAHPDSSGGPVMTTTLTMPPANALTTVDMTRMCQPDADPFTTAALVGALESAWTAIRNQHPEIPAVVIIVGSGSPAKKAAELKYGHYASLRWQLGDTRLPEVLVSGEGLKRTPAEVLTTLLHEATHALADRRGIRDTSRQGRWHNQHFARLAGELGLTARKDDRTGWSPCTLRPDTATRYASVLDEISAAMRAYRHPEDLAPSTRRNNNNGHSLTCGCPRRIRVAPKTAAEGPIVCGLCESPFRNDTDDNTSSHTEGAADVALHAYDPTGQHHGGLPTYPYKLAPRGLATRRQLRALGLRPAGQAVAAQILWRKGKRVAYLYRVDLARPKRHATPAQREALHKAMTARRTCTSCRQVKPYYIPRRYGECLDCTPTRAAA